jgi:F0F1-type ATP synthase membrane subunit c/vacuolar-type H+-ATPase subunit K
MPNLMANATNFPRRINNYVPGMQYSADVNYNGETRVNFGAPLAVVATALGNAISINAAGSADLSGIAALPELYGRSITVVASGAATSNVTVNGWDYLGQPVAESFTLNGATPVAGNKCFKSFASATFGATAATTINIGTGAKLGLPFKALRVVYEVANGALVAAGTLQAPSLVDPATTTTTDPRGAYTPTTALNGVNIISAIFNMANDVNTANRGGLHGIQHAAA